MKVDRTSLFAPAIALLLIAVVSNANAARWIEPDWPQGAEPRYKPVPLYWMNIAQTPYLYRTELTVDSQTNHAGILLRTSGYVYLWVDGVQRYAWQPVPADKRANKPAVPADPQTVHAIDLSDSLTPGKHTICVSAPAGGFVIDGATYAGSIRTDTVATDRTWTVTKSPPTTILEQEAIMLQDFDGPAAPVKVGEIWNADEDALAAAYFQAFVKRNRKGLDDARWRLDLLLKKGIYIVDGRAYGWGGAARLSAGTTIQDANTQTRPVEDATAQLNLLQDKNITDARQLKAALPQLLTLEKQINAIIHRVADISLHTKQLDNAKARKLLAHNRPENLNESLDDRLGWIDHPGLTDSDIAKWQIRFSPAVGPTQVTSPDLWMFSTDPADNGIEQLRYTIGYNIENQWPTLKVADGWQADSRFARYKGPAWYRARINIPAEWSPSPVVLSVRAAGQFRAWLNEREISKVAEIQGDRYVMNISPDKMRFGEENVFACRINADGPKRGLLSGLTLTCPALAGKGAGAANKVDILATPLSPCVILKSQTRSIQIVHDSTPKLILPADSGSQVRSSGIYDYQKDGILASNWALLWMTPDSANQSVRPVLLVFAACPQSISVSSDTTTIRLHSTSSPAVAVRPWTKNPPAITDTAAINKAAEFWSKAALAVPVNYVNITEVARPGDDLANISIDRVPRGPVLRQTYIYDYFQIEDEWQTTPLRIAPLPALCAYAQDKNFRGLELPQQPEDLHDGGVLSAWRGLLGTDRISYSYPIEPYPRFTGFTSWMFSGVDAGVPGNKRELELVAWIGANSYRPQHNWSDEGPPKGFFGSDEKRTRVEITADYCNAVGVNYMNNIDQTLGGPRDAVRNDYNNFITKIYTHYEKIARQLHDRPFHDVAYDLINEPFDHKAELYNAAIKELTRRVRAVDRTHLCYLEPCQSWGAIQNIRLVEPTGDPLTVYSFHDYNFRLLKPDDRWPTAHADISNIHRMWLPAYTYMIDHGVCLHCGEFGGFDHATDDSLAQFTLMNDFFRIFDQFGMHSHYYTGRELFKRQADGSLKPSNIVKFYREYFQQAP